MWANVYVYVVLLCFAHTCVDTTWQTTQLNILFATDVSIIQLQVRSSALWREGGLQPDGVDGGKRESALIKAAMSAATTCIVFK